MIVYITLGKAYITRQDTSCRHLPIGEPKALFYRVNAYTFQNNLHEIANWLNASKSRRYAPSENESFCNVYAYDFCYLSCVYLPRAVFSRPDENGRQELYSEYTSNQIVDWLEQKGKFFGWQKANSLTVLQEQANAGNVCLITARSKPGYEHGHISVVLPESNSILAQRVGENVQIPVQSMAGQQPKTCFVEEAWWIEERYQEPDYWFAAKPKTALIDKYPEAKFVSAYLTRFFWPNLTRELHAQLIIHVEQINNSITISQMFINALVAGEDRRFYKHGGFDLRGIARAIAVYFKRGSIQGASTIEQQLVRTLTQLKRKTFRRKFKEIALAYYISSIFKKNDLARVYLMVAYYGWHMNDLPSALKRLKISFSPSKREACDLVACLRYPIPKEPSSDRLARWQARSAYIEKSFDNG